MIAINYLPPKLTEFDSYTDIAKLSINYLQHDLMLVSERYQKVKFMQLCTSSQLNENEASVLSCMLENENIEYYLDVHIEDIATKKLNNIVLLDVDCMNTDYFRELIRIKSKKTNIIGINLRYDETFRDFLIFIDTLKEQKATDEEIMIGLRLRYSDNIINRYFDYNKYYRVVKTKEIESVNEIIKYIKR